MAKYTHTPIDFYAKLRFKEGLAYFLDIAQLAQEERDAIDTAAKPTQFDPSAMSRRFQGI